MKLMINIVSALALLYSGCSSDQEAVQELENSSSEEASNQEMTSEQSSEQDSGDSDFEAQDENVNAQEQNTEETGAELNSDISNDTQIAEENPPTGQLAQENPSTNSAAAVEQGQISQSQPPPAATQEIAQSHTTSTAELPASTSTKAPIPGGRVRYVPEGGVQVVSEPNGSPILTLTQGDHPLTWEEAGWIKIADGMFVQAGALSDSGVPRQYIGAQFQK